MRHQQEVVWQAFICDDVIITTLYAKNSNLRKMRLLEVWNTMEYIKTHNPCIFVANFYVAAFGEKALYAHFYGFQLIARHGELVICSQI